MNTRHTYSAARYLLTLLLTKALVLFVVLGVLLHDGPANAQFASERIINGSNASEGRWPWMVSIGQANVDPAKGHLCGGALISADHVVTAAHCVNDFAQAPDLLQVTVGRTLLKDVTKGEIIGIKGIAVHPSYNVDWSENDIAVLKLAHPLLTPTIEVISEYDNDDWQPGTLAMILGWGVVDPLYSVRPNNLHQALIPIIADNLCEERLGVAFNPAVMMCAGKLATSETSYDGIDSCQGDSGGPLVVATESGWKLTGIVSWGFSCGSDRYWGVYTKVASFRDWLTSGLTFQPFNRSKPVVEGIPLLGERLKCTPGEWEGDPPIDFSYEWIDEATDQVVRAGPYYKLHKGDRGKSLYCRVHALNSVGVNSADSEPLVILSPSILRKPVKRGQSIRRAARRVVLSCTAQECRAFVRLRGENESRVEATIKGELCHGKCKEVALMPVKVSGDTWEVPLPGRANKRVILTIFVQDPNGVSLATIAVRIRTVANRGKVSERTFSLR